MFECVELELALKLASGEEDPLDSDFSCPIKLHRGNVLADLLLSRPVYTETVTGHPQAPGLVAQLWEASWPPWLRHCAVLQVQEGQGAFPMFLRSWSTVCIPLESE